MAGRHKGHFSDRRAVIERNGKLLSGNVQVSGDRSYGDGSFGLNEETREALDLTEHARLRKCAKCSARFIAHHATRLCSRECRASAKADTSRKMIAKRSKHREWMRREFTPECRQCGNEIGAAARKTRLYCSGACRQRAHAGRLR